MLNITFPSLVKMLNDVEEHLFALENRILYCTGHFKFGNDFFSVLRCELFLFFCFSSVFMASVTCAIDSPWLNLLDLVLVHADDPCFTTTILYRAARGCLVLR